MRIGYHELCVLAITSYAYWLSRVSVCLRSLCVLAITSYAYWLSRVCVYGHCAYWLSRVMRFGYHELCVLAVSSNCVFVVIVSIGCHDSCILAVPSCDERTKVLTNGRSEEQTDRRAEKHGSFNNTGKQIVFTLRR